MRYVAVMTLILLGYSNAFAQAYPPRYAVQPPVQQQANADPYATQPYYAPAAGAPQAQPQPVPQPVQQAPINRAQPYDYGQSVMTDIRQMNF